MMKLNREQLREKLKRNILVIEFTKKNGELRKMECTLDEQYIPPKTNVEGTEYKPKKINESILNVYDLESKGWRSFCFDSIISEKIKED